MKVLVLGRGFFGRATIKRLVEKGHDVVALSRSGDGFDLANLDHAKQAFAELQPNAILNCASVSGGIHFPAVTAMHTNIAMVSNLFEAARISSPRAVLVNPLSSCIYPGHLSRYRETDLWNGEPHETVLAYATSRRLVCVLARCYAAQYGLKSTNLIIPNAFGPGETMDANRAHAIGGMIMRMLDAKRGCSSHVEIWGSGRPEREWIYIDDVAEVLSDAVGLVDPLISPLNIAQGKGCSIAETAKAIKDSVGFQGELWFNVAHPDGAARKVMDDSQFRKIWAHYRFTDHHEAIKRTVAYYRTAVQRQPQYA